MRSDEARKILVFGQYAEFFMYVIAFFDRQGTSQPMGYIALGKNCVFQTLRHYMNYISEFICLQQAILLDSIQN